MRKIYWWIRDVVVGIGLYAAATFIILWMGQLLNPKVPITLMGPVNLWVAYAFRPDIIATAIGVAIAVKYASQAQWVRAISPFKS